MSASSSLTSIAAVDAIKSSLRQYAKSADRGFAADRVAIKALRTNVEALEALNQELAPTRSAKLIGEWALDYTDAADVLSLKLLLAEVGPIRQDVRAGEALDSVKATNAVELRPLLSSTVLAPLGVQPPPVTYAIEADCRVLDDSRLSLVFIGGAIQLPVLPTISSALPSPIVDALQNLLQGRVYLETTYLDENIRVARGPGREIYVLSRVTSDEL